MVPTWEPEAWSTKTSRRASSPRGGGRKARPERRTKGLMRDGHLRQTTEKRLMLFSGEGFPELTERIADRLDIGLGAVDLHRFSGGEMYARYRDSVRGADVFIVQSLGGPVNRNLMKLL